MKANAGDLIKKIHAENREKSMARLAEITAGHKAGKVLMDSDEDIEDEKPAKEVVDGTRKRRNIPEDDKNRPSKGKVADSKMANKRKAKEAKKK